MAELHNITSSEILTGIATTTSVWGIICPPLHAVDKYDRTELRKLEAFAIAFGLGTSLMVSLASKDRSVMDVSLVMLVFLVGAYEWRLSKNLILNQ